MTDDQRSLAAKLIEEYARNMRSELAEQKPVWRDPRRDFGLDPLRAHYEHGHHRHRA
ncbi:MAG TPA: hypothetical protein VIE41_21150 [Methylomirabilota bacterium]|jgi:hypothetical protein